MGLPRGTWGERVVLTGPRIPAEEPADVRAWDRVEMDEWPLKLEVFGRDVSVLSSCSMN